LRAEIRADVEAKINSDLEAKIRNDLEAKIRNDLEVKIRKDLEAEIRADEEAKIMADLDSKIGADLKAKILSDLEAKVTSEVKLKVNTQIQSKLKVTFAKFLNEVMGIQIESLQVGNRKTICNGYEKPRNIVSDVSILEHLIVNHKRDQQELPIDGGLTLQCRPEMAYDPSKISDVLIQRTAEKRKRSHVGFEEPPSKTMVSPDSSVLDLTNFIDELVEEELQSPKESKATLFSSTETDNCAAKIIINNWQEEKKEPCAISFEEPRVKNMMKGNEPDSKITKMLESQHIELVSPKDVLGYQSENSSINKVKLFSVLCQC